MLSAQNFNRLPIVEDTTRSLTVEKDFFEDDENKPMWLVVERCPVNGVYVFPEYYTTRAEAVAAREELAAAML